MLAIKSTVKKRLVGVVNGLTGDRSLREDLMQEAMIHFWKAECERPGQTLSWYLQSCSFHLRHYLASGRSIDSSKRRSLQIELPADEDLCKCVEWSPVEHSVLAQVEVRECIHLLPRYLAPREQAILRCLFEGLKPREIARRLLLSHPTVNKCRLKIAAIAIRLGIGPRQTGQVRPVRMSQRKDHSTALQKPRHSVLGTPENGGARLREKWVKKGPAAAPGVAPATVTNSEETGATRNGWHFDNHNAVASFSSTQSLP